MTQLNFQLPILGQGNSSEDPKVHDALQQIETVVNGQLATDNIQDGALRSTDLDFATVVSALPGSPYDGQLIFFLADATNGVVWLLRYRAGSTSTYKWEFVGGPPLVSFVAATESTVANFLAYQDLTTVGPSITVPIAGDYDVTLTHNSWGAAALAAPAMSYAVGAAAASDNDATSHDQDTITAASKNDNRTRRRTFTPAPTTLTAKYKSTNANAQTTFRDREMRLLPVRVG